MPIFDKETVKLGKLPANIPPKLGFMLDHIEGDLPPPPITIDWTKGQTSWGMMDNDILGDCTCAAVGHAWQVWTLDENVIAEWTATNNQVLQLYENAAGYIPGDPQTDQGAECSPEILSYVKRHNFCGARFHGYGLIKLEIQEIQQAIWMFGGIYIGIQLPITAQAQDVWDVVGDGQTGDSAPGSWGGHCVFLPAFNVDGITCITWGMLQKMTWAFLMAYCDEAYAILSYAWVATGKSPPSFSTASLETNMMEL